jgi:hypothetical protein
MFSIAASILILFFVYVDNEKSIENNEQLITLDTAEVNKPFEYADSARYKDSIEGEMLKIETE